MLQRRLARHADGLAAHGVDRDIPETAARHSDLGREGVEGTAVVGMSSAILEAAKVRVAHQTNIAGLRALDHDDVVFIEVLTLVYEFHLLSQAAFATKARL